MKKKNKIKNYLKIGIFLFGILFALSNCMTEDFQMNENENNEFNKLKVKTISINDFNSKKEIQKKLKLLATKYDINKTYNKNNINSNDGSFTILTDEILEVSTDSITTTYTFRIETPTDSISSFENFMIEQKNDTLKFFIYKFIYDETFPDFFPYETSIQNVDDNQINSEDFNEYLKDGYEIGGDGCLYYHTEAYYVHYSISQAEYYGTDGFWVPASDELIFCPEYLEADPSTSSGGDTSAGSDYADGDYGNGTDNGNNSGASNTNGGGNTGNTNNGQNNSNPEDGNINIDNPPSFVVLPPKGKRTTKKRLLNLVNNPVIKSKIQELLPKINSNVSNNYHEDGYHFKFENNTYTPRQATEIYPHKVSYNPPYEDKETVALHIHQTKWLNNVNGVNYPEPNSPIFSDGDIPAFLDQVDYIDSTNPELTDDVTSLLMTVEGLFALVVKDKDKADAAQTFLEDDDNYEEFKEDFKEEVLEGWENNIDNNTELINKFKHFLKTHKLDGQTMGIDLYQAEIDGNNNVTSWNKL